MSGRALGTVIGAVVGFFIPVVGIAVGGAIGGAIGGLFDKGPHTEGPRLDDLKVQYSTYGVGIPRVYGTERFNGNVIWSTDKLEIATTTEAGKGGGGATNTSYQYYVHMTILLCETPRDGSTVAIRKLWKDGKLVYDISSGISIGSALATADSPYTSLELFQGEITQLPDPIEESWTGGPGSCSAYRGVVRMRLIAVECPGGRVPQFSAELMVNPASGNESVLGTGSVINGNASTIMQPRSHIPTNGDPIPVFIKQNVGSDQSIGAYALGLDYVSNVASSPLLSIWGAYSHLTGRSDIPLCAIRGIGPGGSPDSGNLNFYDGNGVLAKALAVDTLQITSSGRYCKFGNYVCVSSDPGSLQKLTKLHEWDSGELVGSATGSDPFDILLTANFAWLVYKDPSSYRYTVEVRSLVDFSVVTSGMLPTDFGAVLNATSLCVGATVDTIGAVTVYNTVVGPFLATLWKIDVSVTATAIDTSAVSYPSGLLVDDSRIAIHGTDVYGVSQLTTAGPTWTMTPFMYRFGVAMPTAAKVSDIIAAECELAGVTTYDVSGIPDSDTVIGYKLANPASARANIEPLLTLIGGYVVDEDGVTKFRKFADITSVATISFDELGQAEGDASGEAMPLNRTQEIDLPRSVTTSYIEQTSDYQTAAETEVRQVTDATEDVQIQLPICVTSNQAKKVSQMALYDRWRRQNSRSAIVSRKFAAVSPGDGVTVEYPRGTFKLWLVLSTNDTGAVCEWSLCPGDASIFTQTATGATGYVGQVVAPLAAPLRAQILDIPPVRDADNNAGPYVALDSYAAVPADGELFVGDDDTSLLSRGTVSASAPIGFGETTGAWAPLTVDEKSVITVSLGDDVFASVTRDVLLSGGGEHWAYGAAGRWEIGASAQGTSLGGGRYTLMTHLRGLFGTERFVGTQQIGDTFVLLRIAGMLRPDTGVGGIGQSKSYRAVTKGRSKDSAASQTYANTGEGLMPLSPINLRRTDTNDFTVDRRSRLAMNNSTGALPLGEATEAYSWAFYSSGTYATLLGTVVTNTATVTAAQIAAIGVTPSATAFLKVRQVSDSIGPGHELQATA